MFAIYYDSVQETSGETKEAYPATKALYNNHYSQCFKKHNNLNDKICCFDSCIA